MHTNQVPHNVVYIRLTTSPHFAIDMHIVFGLGKIESSPTFFFCSVRSSVMNLQAVKT